MPKLIQWNLSCLHKKSRELTGPLPVLYIRDLVHIVEELQGVFLAGIQIGDCRRFCVANPRFATFPPVLYNPVVLEQYDIIQSESEGCLSFPGLWVSIPRYKYVTVQYMDGTWQEKTATFGSEDQNTEDALLAKAIQHEIFHMNGVTLVDRIQDPKKRLKISARIMKESIKQNKARKAPKLIEGPSELDPPNLSLTTDGDVIGLSEETSPVVV